MGQADTILFGRNILKEAFAAKAKVQEIYFETPASRKFAEGIFAVKSQKIPLIEGIPHEFKHQAHQGIAFKTTHEFYTPYSLPLLKKFPFVIFCNHIEDIHNFGSIARCAAAFGAKMIVHEEKNSASLTAAAVKSSAGLAFRTSFMKASNIVHPLKDLAAEGFSVVGLDAGKKSVSMFDWSPQFPLALVLGSEGSGIEPIVSSVCQEFVKIPMEKFAESLNVSHAAGIAMNWAYRNIQI